MVKQIFAFIGRAGSGKDTFASIIEEQINNTKKIAFAGEIKKELSRHYKIDEIHFHDRVLKESFNEKILTTPRKAMQNYGTFIRSLYGFQYWTNIVKERILNMTDDTTVIVTDVRYPHEVEMLLNLGAKFIFINRDHVLGKLNTFNAHDSELIVSTSKKYAQEFSDNYVEVINDKSIDFYKKNLMKLIKK